MDTFNKKSLCVALAATGVLGAAGVAQAVNVSADGVGSVLIYPYYTVNKDVNGNTFNTLMSVVNSTASTKAVKVRFREGKFSDEVLDFNVFLSPWDVWTASITPVAAGGAVINTSDKSCTIPTNSQNPFPAQFRTQGITDDEKTLARTQEGYFEIFEMATYTDTSIVGTNAKHSGGTPKNCLLVTNSTASSEAQPPTGGLFGDVTIYSPAGGGMFSRPAVALANFMNTPSYQDTLTLAPTYSNATPPVSNVIAGTVGTPQLYQSTWGAGSPNAVTAILMADKVAGQYALEGAAKSQSTWMLTFPTKSLHVTQTAFTQPFTKAYTTKVGACENFYGVFFDREEATPQTITSTDFSPPIPGDPGVKLCFEAQSVGIGSKASGATATSNIFGSANHVDIKSDYVAGWLALGFNSATGAAEHFLPNSAQTRVTNLNTGVQASGQSVTYYGLPVVGFAAQTQQNDAIVVGSKTYLSTFGSTSPLRAVKNIQ